MAVDRHVTPISPENGLDAVLNDGKTLVVDVRTLEEWASGKFKRELESFYGGLTSKIFQGILQELFTYQLLSFMVVLVNWEIKMFF